MDKITIGIPIDLQKLIDTRALVQAGSGGGKSYMLRKLIESVGTNVQQIVIDPEGEFVTIREKFDFALVAKDGDIPLSLKYAEMLAHKLLETNLSAIIDLYELPPHERVLFVKRFLTALINAPKNLWHPCVIYVDEADKFAPEGKASESVQAVINLCAQGRKRGYSAVLATQRLSKLSKDASAELLNKFIGRTGQDIDRKRAGDELGFTNKTDYIGLRELEPGDFYAFGPAISNEVKKFRVGKVLTTHRKSGETIIKSPPTPNAIKSILTKLADIPQEAEKELATKQQLQAEVTKLRGELTRAIKSARQPAPARPDNSQPLRAENDKLKTELQDTKKNSMGMARAYNQLLAAVGKIKAIAQDSIDKPVAMQTAPAWPAAQQIANTGNKLQESVKKTPVCVQKFSKTENTGARQLGKCAREIVRFLATFPNRQWSKAQVGIAIGYSPNTGGFNNALSELTSAGLILRGGTLQVNVDALDEILTILGGLSPQEYNIETFKSKLTKCESEIYVVLLAQPDAQFTKEQLADLTESKYSGNAGGFNNSLSRLTTLELIERNRGLIRLNPELLELM